MFLYFISIIVFYQYLLDDDEEVRTNACFGLGVLCQVAGQHLVNQYETILNRLSHVLSKETNRRMIDNICSCICRMILISPKHIPLGQVNYISFVFFSIWNISVQLGSTGDFSTFTTSRRFC